MWRAGRAVRATVWTRRHVGANLTQLGRDQLKHNKACWSQHHSTWRWSTETQQGMLEPTSLNLAVINWNTTRHVGANLTQLGRDQLKHNKTCWSQPHSTWPWSTETQQGMLEPTSLNLAVINWNTTRHVGANLTQLGRDQLKHHGWCYWQRSTQSPVQPKPHSRHTIRRWSSVVFQVKIKWW